MSGGTDTNERDDTMVEKPGARGRVSTVVIVILVIALVIAILLLVESWGSDDGDNLVPVTSTTLAAAPGPATLPVIPDLSSEPTGTLSPSVTLSPDLTDPPTSVPDDPLAGAVYPLPDSGVTYTDPAEAARGFAVDFVGFTDPIVGEFMKADSRSGELEIRATEEGPVTIAFLRELTDDGTWWVLGAASQNVVVEEPDVRDTVSSPLTVTGQSRVFEGTVNVELRADGIADPLFEGVVTGGAGPEFGPFEGTFEFEQPDGGGGALLGVVYSAEDGNVAEAMVMRVFFPAA